jgi:hypothetical protein
VSAAAAVEKLLPSSVVLTASAVVRNPKAKGMLLYKPDGASSDVWTRGALFWKAADIWMWICSLCGEEVKYSLSSRTTSNALNHLTGSTLHAFARWHRALLIARCVAVMCDSASDSYEENRKADG